MQSRRLLLLFSALSLWSAAPGAAPGPAAAEDLRAAWQKVALNLFADAHREFLALPGDEARLGVALTRLQLQPRTTANLEASVADLRALASAKDPDLAPIALYHLARIEHAHRLRSDPPAALAAYAELRRSFPGHPLADEALVRMAMIEVYEPAPPEHQAATLARYAALAPELASADARRDLHLLLADAALRLTRDESAALAHYLAAEQAGIQLAAIRTTVLVSIGELAARLGRPELARRAFDDYLAFAPRDNRRTLVLERLAALPPAASPAASLVHAP